MGKDLFEYEFGEYYWSSYGKRAIVYYSQNVMPIDPPIPHALSAESFKNCLRDIKCSIFF